MSTPVVSCHVEGLTWFLHSWEKRLIEVSLGNELDMFNLVLLHSWKLATPYKATQGQTPKSRVLWLFSCGC